MHTLNEYCTPTLLTSDSSLVLCWDKSWLVHSFGCQVSVASHLIVGSLLINYKIGDQWSHGLIQFLLVHKANENTCQPVSCSWMCSKQIVNHAQFIKSPDGTLILFKGIYCLKPLEIIIKLNLKVNNAWSASEKFTANTQTFHLLAFQGIDI